MVYVVQEALGKNILPAEDFGDLEVLLPPGNIVLSPVPTIKKLRDKLKDFGDNDYLLLIGDPAAIGIACMVASDTNGGKVNMLKWDRQELRYYPVTVDLFHERRNSG